MTVDQENVILREKAIAMSKKINEYKNICIDVKNSILRLQEIYPESDFDFQCNVNRLNSVLND